MEANRCSPFSPISVTAMTENNEENYSIHVANRKIRINFHHGGIYCFLPNDREKINSLLDKVMSHYGYIKDAWFDEEFMFGYITYATHEQAQKALAGLRNESKLHEILGDVCHTVEKDTQSIDFQSPAKVRFAKSPFQKTIIFFHSTLDFSLNIHRLNESSG